ncbi:MAG: ATP-binding protein, partial [Candidatus Saccharimonadales bacterium]
MAIFLIGLFTLSKNVRSATNILFAVLCSALIGWTTANYFSVNLKEPEQIFTSIKVIFAFVVLQNMAFFLFVSIFPAIRSNLNKLKSRIYIYLSLAIGILALVGVYFQGYEYKSDGEFKLLASPPIVLFILHAAFSIGWGMKRLFLRYSSASGVLRNQLLYLITASILLLVLVPLTNFVLPIAFKNTTFIAFSPLYTFFFAAIIAYAIVRQKLFNIRLVVARSAAYAMVVGTLALIYGGLIFTVSRVVVGDSDLSELVRQGINIVFALILVFSFQPIKRFFDRYTNRLFYRDAYNSQDVLDEINSLLTSQISLKTITHDSLRIICHHLKIDGGHFLVMEQASIYRTASYGQVSEPITFVHPEDLKIFKKSMIIVDELVRGETKEFLDKHRLSVALRLVTQEGVVGYIFLSGKQSGNIYTRQDLDLLGILTDEMAIAVQNARAFEEIQQFNITLQQKIEEATRELRRVNARLREIDKTKDEFISMASHQLRTPLTAVKGYLSMVLEGDVGPVKKAEKEMIKRAFDGAQRMVYLIGDMLNVSRLQTGKFVIENQPTNLAELVAGEVSQLQEAVENKQLKLTYHKPAKFPTLSLDETKIRQVVMNFLDNALYYTPSGGSITADLSASDEAITFTVTDTGLGVPASVQHHLFSKFYRADNARKMRPDGTGLGLFMAKKVIAAQGGAIIFKSTEGKGSTFGFSFPLKSTSHKELVA